MFEYKIHTQRDKTFSGAFDPTEFEAALNAHAVGLLPIPRAHSTKLGPRGC